MRILALDLGTSAMKLMRMDDFATVLSVDRIPMSGLSVECWIAALATNLEQHGDRRQISGIAITGQMHGLVTRESGDAWGEGIPWNDNRAAPLIPELRERIGEAEMTTGGPIVPGFMAASLAWVRQHDAARWNRITSVHLPKDALIYALTGQHVTDPSDAVGTGMYSPATGDWSWDIVDALGIPRDWLPRIIPSGSIAGGLRPNDATRLGLPHRLPIILAGGDAPVGTFGAGVTRESDALVLLSTGAQVIRPVHEWLPDAAGLWYTWPSVTSETSDDAPWLNVGTLLNAGNTNDWAASVLQTEVSNEAPTGLLALPHLIGTREDPTQRGAVLGLSSATTARDIRQALLEGIAFSIRTRLNQMTGAGTPPSCVHIGGGLAYRSDVRQLFADVLGTPVEAVAEPNLSAYGAGLLAIWTLTGRLPDLPDDARNATRPRRDVSRHYAALSNLWRDMDETLAPISARLASFTWKP